MDTLKPVVDEREVAALLEREFGEPIHGLSQIAGGNVARTFAFDVGGHAYVVRFNQHMAANFEKEALIAGRLDPARVPVPRIIRLGRLGDLRYAVSERIDGTPLTRLPPAEAAALAPALLDTLDAINAVDRGAAAGAGIFGDDGDGLFPSWRAYLEAVRDEEPEWDYFGKWHVLFDTTFLERDVFDRLYERMAGLLDACPEERQLVHGNIGFGNVLARDGRIVAVLDWLDAAWGDPVFDVAWLDFWGVGANWATTFRERQTRAGIDVPNFDERIRCYQLCDGLGAMKFFAKQGAEAEYRWVRERLLALPA